MNFFLNALYRATEGEGVRLGIPQIFIRFQGCAIGCLNCDSKQTWDFGSVSSQSFEEVCQKIEELSQSSETPLKSVSITGGDPLHPMHIPALFELVQYLKAQNYFVNLEASGLRIVNELFAQVDYISFDYKTPSTGVKGKVENILTMAQNFSQKFQIKAVISDQNDFNDTLSAYHKVKEQLGTINFPWCLTPAYSPGEKFPLQRFQEVLSLNEKWGGPFRVIGQQHKWLYGPDAEKV